MCATKDEVLGICLYYFCLLKSDYRSKGNVIFLKFILIISTVVP